MISLRRDGEAPDLATIPSLGEVLALDLKDRARNQVLVEGAERFKPLDDRVNVVGTCRVLAEARRHAVPVVHVSSFTTLVGRDAFDGQLLDETTELLPNRLCGAYPRSKRQAELFVQAAAANGQPACIVMPSAPVGAGDPNLTPPSAMIRDLALGRTPALLDCMLDLVDVEAVIQATLAALEKGRPGERYLLTGEAIPLRELAASVAEITGTAAPKTQVPISVALLAARAEALLSRVTRKPPRAPLTGVRLAARKVRFSSQKARDELGFAPRPITDVLPGAVRWLRDHYPAERQG